MKEIKAYIRRDEINEVVERLQRAGAPGVSVIEIHPVGYGYEASPFEPTGHASSTGTGISRSSSWRSCALTSSSMLFST